MITNKLLETHLMKDKKKNKSKENLIIPFYFHRTFLLLRYINENSLFSVGFCKPCLYKYLDIDPDHHSTINKFLIDHQNCFC